MQGVSFDVFYGAAFGDVAERLMAANMDPGALRPWCNSHSDPVSYITLTDKNGKKTNRVFAANNPTTLTKDQWIQLDESILRVARDELRLYSDIVSAGLTYNVPRGMATTVIQHQRMTDAGSADLSMDGLARTNKDRPHVDLINLPLPLVHGEYEFPLRQLMTSEGSGMPLDPAMAEQTTRRIAELTERLFLGTYGTYSFGGGTIYGLTNFPQRITKTITLPTDPTWTPQTLIAEVLDMIQSLQDVNFKGPYSLYYSRGWTKYMDDDYSSTYGGKTLRQRIADIDMLSNVRRLDYLPNFQLVLVNMDSGTIQAVNFMPLTSLQWQTQGGLSRHFKIIGGMVPRIRANTDNNTGICHATAA